MKRALATASITLVLVTTLATNSWAATKAGAVCKSAGATSVVGNKKFICIKSGKKLIWNKGTFLPKPVPKSTAEANGQSTQPVKPVVLPTYTQASSFASSDLCKIKNPTAAKFDETLSFQRPSFSIPTLGVHKALVYFVDFPDVPFQEKQISEWKLNQVPTFEKYISEMSYGKLKYEVDINETVFHISKSSLTYNLDTPHDAPRKPNADQSGLIRDAIAAADPTIDFSKYQFFNVVMPSTTNIGSEGASGMDPNMLLDGKSFTRLTIGPIREYVDQPLKKIWLLHESGHIMGLQHAFKPGNSNMPVWGAMSNGVTAEPEFVSWERYILGWISDAQNPCIDSSIVGKYVVPVAPLSSSVDANKMVTIRLNDHQAIIAEYRTANPLSKITKEQEGVFIYTVDVKVRGDEGAMKAVVPDSLKNRLPLGTLIAGEKVTFSNITIKILGNYSDRSDLEIEVK
jgi:M6 family metalloprotease-like protein